MGYTRDPRIAKMPLWLQEEVRGLERQVRELRADLEEATVAPEGSNTTLDPYSDYSRDLPANPTIRHYIEGTRGYFETKFDGRKLNVRGVSDSGFDDFLVVPQLSNEIVVEYRKSDH